MGADERDKEKNYYRACISIHSFELIIFTLPNGQIDGYDEIGSVAFTDQIHLTESLIDTSHLRMASFIRFLATRNEKMMRKFYINFSSSSSNTTTTNVRRHTCLFSYVE
uniref:Uncharacterized protein n=1 Tax=Glossina pallidipes TaxID=7398 RepID=A0A1A9ZNH6_GLOPL